MKLANLVLGFLLAGLAGFALATPQEIRIHERRSTDHNNWALFYNELVTANAVDENDTVTPKSLLLDVCFRKEVQPYCVKKGEVWEPTDLLVAGFQTRNKFVGPRVNLVWYRGLAWSPGPGSMLPLPETTGATPVVTASTAVPAASTGLTQLPASVPTATPAPVPLSVATAPAVATATSANGIKPEELTEAARLAARIENKGLSRALEALNSQVEDLKGNAKTIKGLQAALKNASSKTEITDLKEQLTTATAQMEKASKTFKTSQEGLSAMMANLPAETRGIAEHAVKEGLKAIKVDSRPWYLKYAVEFGLGILSVFVGIAFFLILSNRKVMKNEIGKQIKVAAKPILQMAGDAHTAAVGAHGVAIVLAGQLHAVVVKADEAKAMAGRAVVLVEGQQERLKSTKGWVVLPPDFAVEVAKLLKEDEAYHPGIKVTDGVGEAVMYWIEIRLHPKKGAGWYQVNGIKRLSEVKAENLVSALHRQGGFGDGENRYVNLEVPDQVEARSEGLVSGSPVPSGDAATAPSASVNGAESMDPPVATIPSGDEKVA